VGRRRQPRNQLTYPPIIPAGPADMAGPAFRMPEPRRHGGPSRHGRSRMSEGAVESAPDTGEESAEQMLEQAVAEPADDELDDTSGEQQDQPEPSRPAPGPNGFPLNTPVAQMTTEEREAYWKYNARKWEKDAKANSEAAKRWAEFEESQK